MAKCDVCGNYSKIRYLGNVNICEDCFDKLHKLRAGDLGLLIHYLDETNYKNATQNGKDYMLSQATYSKNEIYGSEVALRPKLKEEEASRKTDMNKMITTGSRFEGYAVTEYLGLLYGEIVVPNGLLGAFTSGTFFTIDALNAARKEAVETLISKANDINADGILGIDIDIEDLNGRGILVSANGTAVKLHKKENSTSELCIDVYMVDEINAIQIKGCQVLKESLSDPFVFRIFGKSRKRLSAISVRAGINTVFGDTIDIGRLAFTNISFDPDAPSAFCAKCLTNISDITIDEMKTLLLTIEKCVINDEVLTYNMLKELAPQDTSDSLSSHWAFIQDMNGAIEIYNYLLNQNIQDEYFLEEILPKLETLAMTERMYGNKKAESLSCVEQYINTKKN